ncbi:MAG: YihA family ribosome biogenesis GTP-binding protein [Bacteroidales bacterium]|nr:YihA family ribosome biogenesis GTP-binding protein [Bacteroidales bacterium]
MIIKSAQFLKSSPNVESCPHNVLPEYAFIGRSNVGKSSLINMLTGHSKLAKTSSTPGKTQVINHFLINEDWFIVDLPGYGYAKTSKTKRAEFGIMIEDYIVKRETMICLFVLVDSRHEPLQNDLEFFRWLAENEIPFVIVFTKMDKLNVAERKTNIETYKNKMLEEWEYLPEVFLTAATTKEGRDEILDYIENINNSIQD